MALRTTQSSVTFRSPFEFTGTDGVQPAGAYDVEIEEESIETISRTVYVRMATRFYIRSPGMVRTVTINPDDLEAALEKDRRNR